MSAVMDLKKHRINVAEFHRMGDSGFFAPDARLELIDGEVFEMSPIGSAHSSVLDRLVECSIRHKEKNQIVRVQNPLVIDVQSELYPDLCLVDDHYDGFALVLPRAEHARWVVEIADSTEKTDRLVKIPRYLQAGISEVWLVCINSKSIEVYQPAQPMQLIKNGSVTPACLPELKVELTQVFRGLY
jgi:Uma2 family endonuclease